MTGTLQLICGVAQFVMLFYAVYRLVLAVASMLMPRAGGQPEPGPQRTMAVLIPAHNEETVIGPLLDSLSQQDYPSDRSFVAVVADNCSDGTATLARERGVLCYERSEPGGKGAALGWLLKQLERDGHGFDACLCLDADNLAPPNLLRAADAVLTRWPAAQGIRASKNASDGWVSSLDHLSEEVLNNLVEDAGRARLGLPVKLAGSGMAIRAETLKRVSWEPTTVTEDQEYGVRLLLAGERTGWAPKLVVYDEKQTRTSGARRQRGRWFRGRLQVLRLYALPLLARSARQLDPVAFDQIVYLLLPPRSLHVAGLAGLLLLSVLFPSSSLWWPWQAWAAGLVAWGLYLGVGVSRSRTPWRTWSALLAAPVFAAGSLLALALGLLRAGDRSWGHSRHTRDVRLEELEPGG